MPSWASAFLVKAAINLAFWCGVAVMILIWTAHGAPPPGTSSTNAAENAAKLSHALTELMNWQLLVFQLLSLALIAFVAMLLRRGAQEGAWKDMADKIDEEIAVLAVNIGSILLSTSLLIWSLHLEPGSEPTKNAAFAVVAYALACYLSKR